MKLQIFIETGEGGILIDRTYLIRDDKAPPINLQDLIDEAKTLFDQQLKDDVNNMVKEDKLDY